MKKLFTLIALLACFMGAKAEWVTDYSKQYSEYSDFPFYVMGYAPSIIDGTMVDNPVPYRKLWRGDESDFPGADQCTQVTVNGASFYEQSLDANPWRQYFIADGIPTELDGTYKVVAMVKASEPVNVPIQMRWSWSADPATGTMAIGTEWSEVEVTFSGIGGTSCSLIAQPGTTEAVIEWKSITVSHNQKAQRPTTWQEWLNSDGQPFVMSEGAGSNDKYMGDAETPWSDPNVAYNDADKNYLICAWSKEKGRNMDANGEAWNPFPANIEVDPTDASNHVFVVHGQPATTEGDPSAWDNQFWIQSPQGWKEGTQVKIHFRYRASKTAKADTQIHKQTPSDYLHWNAIGEITFTEEWQTIDKTFTFDSNMANGWSMAFNLNKDVKEAVDFYFDDLSWQTMKLDEGLFVASANTEDGIEYDFDNATPMEYDASEKCYVATVGEAGAYVNQVMISTVRGNDAAFKGNTLKPEYVGDYDEGDWAQYTEASIAKINLPGTGIWKVFVDPNYTSMAFKMLEGTVKENVDIVTNPTEIIIEGVERDDLSDGDNVREEEGGTGETWDNQFFILANRVLEPNEETVLEFDYVATTEAGTTTGTHALPGQYRKNAIPDFTFTTELQHLKVDYTVPASDWGGNAITDAQSISFDLAMIKGANTYTIKNVKWYVKDGSNAEGKTPENLINATGTSNFWVKIGAGTSPYEYGTSTGIENVVNGNVVNGNDALYNIAGQRVNKDYKGIVIQNGKKFINK